MEELDAITQALLTYGPALVSIITMICTVIISIKRIAGATRDSLKEVRDINKSNEMLKEDIALLLQENAALKEQLEECLNRLNNVTVPKDE